MLESDSSSSPVWKRARTEHIQSRVLATRHNERAFALALDGLRSLQRWEKLEEALSEDLPTRFVECVYVCLYLPSKYPPTAPEGRAREGDTLSSLLRLLLKHLRSQPAHLRNTIPRPAGRVAGGAAAVSCGSRAGTLRTARVSTARTARSRGGTLPESGARFVSVSSARDVVLLCQLHSDLHMDLGTLTDDIVERTVSAARGASERDTESGAGGGECERDGMRALCDTAILHYDDTSHTRDADNSIELMCGVLQVCASETGVAVVLNRLLEGQGRNMGERAADCLIKTLVPLMSTLPQHMTSTLVRCLPALPARALHTHAHHIHKLTDRSLDKWRACLQLLCGAERTLLAHCEALQQALHNKDGAEWGRAFVRMREEVFDTTLAGPDYRALHTHKQTLYDVEHTGRDTSPSNVSSCASAVRAVEAAVRGAPPRARRSVAALCPALAERRDAAAALACLLRLPEEHVLGLEDEIPVFTDSVCEPGVVSVRMRGAPRRRYLIKRERVSLAASAGAFARALSRHSHSEPQVIVLSEDCGLVEFLEGHERVRDLIQEEVDLAGIPVERHARRNEELILASEHLALDNTRILHHVPPLALRRAFTRRCADTAHFLSAQRQYVAALARVTLHTWLAGLGDRHLNNVLVCPRAGALCAVDSGALLQREPVPARLTAQLRAVAPHGCLEASLQQGVRDARDRRRRLMPLLKLALHIALPEPALEVREVEALLRGTLLSHEATCPA